MDEDAVLLALGKLQGEMTGINNEIRGIKDLLGSESRNCKDCKTSIDTSIQNIKDQQSKWLGRDGVIVVIVPLAISVVGLWLMKGGSS
jgi:hypothetical protein